MRFTVTEARAILGELEGKRLITTLHSNRLISRLNKTRYVPITVNDKTREVRQLVSSFDINECIAHYKTKADKPNMEHLRKKFELILFRFYKLKKHL